jgi:hypothetical protein
VQELDTDGDNSKEDQKDDAISINEQQMETG